MTLGSVTWPVLKAQYPKEQAGGVLAAAGIGAILSPPTLGAAAFIIAEFLKVSYGTVLLWACVPTLLYYLGIILAIETDARRFGTASRSRRRRLGAAACASATTSRRWARSSCCWPPGVAVQRGRRGDRAPVRTVLPGQEHRLTPRRRPGARPGRRAVLPVAATCAAAGIIVAVVALTGLGLTLRGIVVITAAGSASDRRCSRRSACCCSAWPSLSPPRSSSPG